MKIFFSIFFVVTCYQSAVANDSHYTSIDMPAELMSPANFNAEIFIDCIAMLKGLNENPTANYKFLDTREARVGTKKGYYFNLNTGRFFFFKHDANEKMVAGEQQDAIDQFQDEVKSNYQALATLVVKHQRKKDHLSEKEKLIIDRLGQYMGELKQKCPDDVLKKYIPDLEGDGYFKIGKTSYETYLPKLGV